MADEAIEAVKADLRKDAHAVRAALSDEVRAEAAKAVATHFFESIAYAPEDVIAGYWRIRDELDCQPILIRLMDSGQKVVLPVVEGDEAPLDLRVWEADAPLYEAGFGTLARALLVHALLLVGSGSVAGGLLALVLRAVLDRTLPTIELMFTPADLVTAVRRMIDDTAPPATAAAGGAA